MYVNPREFQGSPRKGPFLSREFQWEFQRFPTSGIPALGIPNNYSGAQKVIIKKCFKKDFGNLFSRLPRGEDWCYYSSIYTGIQGKPPIRRHHRNPLAQGTCNPSTISPSLKTQAPRGRKTIRSLCGHFVFLKCHIKAIQKTVGYAADSG